MPEVKDTKARIRCGESQRTFETTSSQSVPDFSEFSYHKNLMNYAVEEST